MMRAHACATSCSGCRRCGCRGACALQDQRVALLCFVLLRKPAKRGLADLLDSQIATAMLEDIGSGAQRPTHVA
eukprot:982143-Alexandrium_andersonii.AAC.1